MSTEFEETAREILGSVGEAYLDDDTVDRLTAASQADQVKLLERLKEDADGTMTDQCWIAMRKRIDAAIAQHKEGMK